MGLGFSRAARVLAAVVLAALFLSAAPFTQGQEGEHPYVFADYRLDVYVNADYSLHVQEKVTYRFADVGVWVGIYIPFSYGAVSQPRVLNQYGRPVPEELQDVSWDDDGVEISYDARGESGETTIIYDYLTYDSLQRSEGLVGLKWVAVPELHKAPIEKASAHLYLPRPVDPGSIRAEGISFDYTQPVAVEVVGDQQVSWTTSGIPPNASYSIWCFWPSSIMDAEAESPPQDGIIRSKSWDFERFDVDITVNEDASLLVRETQVVNFHGSFSFLNRDLSGSPAEDMSGKSYGKVRFSDIKVFDLEGNPYDKKLWKVQNIPYGKRIHVEFSAQDEQKGFIFEYRMKGAILFYDGYDRLYYDAVSSERDVPIARSETRVRFPAGADLDEVRTELYVGRYSWEKPFAWDHGREDGEFWFKAYEVMPYSTYTIDLAFPKGIVQVPWPYRGSTLVLCLAVGALILLSVTGFMLALWLEKGRDEGRTGTGMVRYDPPPGIRPAVLGMLMREDAKVSDIVATIVDLACRGYLKIGEQGKGGVFDKRSFTFAMRKPSDPLLLDYEEKVMLGLFEKGNQVSQDDLEDAFYQHVNGILQSIREQVARERFFAEDPSLVKRRYTRISFLLAAALSVAWIWTAKALDLGHLYILFLSGLLSCFMVFSIGLFMPRRTAKGREAYEHAVGFRKYLAAAEKEELADMDVGNFQDTLPYAMVLGVTEEWGRKMQGFMTAPPEWFEGAGGFSPAYLAVSMSQMTTSLGATLMSSPSSSSGSSGFGGSSGGFGGGSAGGGFGGGGSSAG